MNRYICIDAVDGPGKSTAIKTIISHIENRYGGDVVSTREPGGTPLAEEIRGIFKSSRVEDVDLKTEVLLMLAARCQLVENFIKPALQQKKWVVSDRGHSSLLAYQVHGRGASRQFVDLANTFVMGHLRPSLTIILDVDPEVAKLRIGGRDTSDEDRLDSEAASFFARVRTGYLSLAEHEPNYYKVVDASGTVEEVAEKVRQTLDQHFLQVDSEFCL